jgi:hypothetical protein
MCIKFYYLQRIVVEEDENLLAAIAALREAYAIRDREQRRRALFEVQRRAF